MKSKTRGLWIVTIAGILALVAVPISSVSAEEPEPVRTEEPEQARTEEPAVLDENGPETTEGATSTGGEATAPALTSGAQSTTPVTVSSGKAKKPRSLADLASGIDLNAPKGEGSDSIIISNENLRTMGKGAVISQGSNIGGSSTEPDWFVPPSARGSAPSDEEIEAARNEVARLEGQASTINQAVEENKAVNLYTGGGPQYRAPGQTDPLRNQQDKTNQELADARSRLAAMEKAAADGARAGASSGTPSPEGGDGE